VGFEQSRKRADSLRFACNVEKGQLSSLELSPRQEGFEFGAVPGIDQSWLRYIRDRITDSSLLVTFNE
jgi:hypothetical protein